MEEKRAGDTRQIRGGHDQNKRKKRSDKEKKKNVGKEKGKLEPRPYRHWCPGNMVKEAGESGANKRC